MNAATTETFAPVTIGISPAGVEWIAYKPEHVEPMRARLAALRARSYVATLTVRARGGNHRAELCGTVGARPVYLLHMKTCRRIVTIAGNETVGYHAWSPLDPTNPAIVYLDNAAGRVASALRY